MQQFSTTPKDFPHCLLTSRKLKITNNRLFILSLFGNGDISCSFAKLRQSAEGIMDRVTMYRIIEIFIKRNVLMTINDANGERCLIINRQMNKSSNPTTMLRCSKCNLLTNISPPPVRYLRMLSDFNVQPQFLFNGICKNCRSH